MDDTMVTSLRINREIWKEAKKKALDLDLSIAKFVEISILHEIQKKNR